MTQNAATYTATRGRVAGLDALRGLAILLVLLRHSAPNVFGGAGIVGVVIFFALSGYLITGLLMRDMSKYGRIRYGRFYRNRAFRLLPALLLFVAVLVIVIVAVDPLNDRDQLLRTVVVSLSYTANLPFDHGSDAISHLWTLATEEQFYLVWPLLVALGFRMKRLRLVLWATGVGLFLVCAASVLIAGDSVAALYSLPTSWAISMVIGAAAQIGKRKLDDLMRLNPWVAGTTIALAFALLLGLSLAPDLKTAPGAYLFGGTAIGSATVVLIWFAERQEKPTSLLHPLIYLGTISYAAYLWNWPIALWLEQSPAFHLAGPLSVVITLCAATISWFALERPVQQWRSRLDAREAVK